MLLAARGGSRALRRACVPRTGPRLAAIGQCRGNGSITVQHYHELASCTLNALHETFDIFADALPASNDLREEMDVDFSGDVLNVMLGERGTFVLNKQAPNKQLWLSSPLSGPLRYDYSIGEAAWINHRDACDNLLVRLSQDIERLAEEPLCLKGVGVALKDCAHSLSLE